MNLIDVAAGTDLPTTAAQRLPQNMQVTGSKVLIENWIDVRGDGAVGIGHEIPDESKTDAAAEARSWHG